MFFSLLSCSKKVKIRLPLSTVQETSASGVLDICNKGKKKKERKKERKRKEHSFA